MDQHASLKTDNVEVARIFAALRLTEDLGNYGRFTSREHAIADFANTYATFYKAIAEAEHDGSRRAD